MTLTVTVRKTDGNPSQFGTSLGSTTLAEPAAWTRVTAVNDLAPQAGAMVEISSDNSAFRFAVTPPSSSQRTGEADNPPRANGRLMPIAGQLARRTLVRGAQVWVRQA